MSVLADKLGNISVLSSTIHTNVSVENYYGLARDVSNTVTLNEVALAGKVSATSASGLAHRLKSRLTIANLINT